MVEPLTKTVDEVVTIVLPPAVKVSAGVVGGSAPTVPSTSVVFDGELLPDGADEPALAAAACAFGVAVGAVPEPEHAARIADAIRVVPKAVLMGPPYTRGKPDHVCIARPLSNAQAVRGT
jgi:hypothetical protein